MLETGSVTDLREQVASWRRADQSVALVPTMGNLHPGHLRLVEHARAMASRVVVSIFVNPTQFGPGEDLDSYPRTLAADREKLVAGQADMLFTPAVETVYPLGEGATVLTVPQLSAMLCGASRPGHFAGVATVVAKLLHMAQPDVAVFGEKDFQQLVVIRRLVTDLWLPVHIEGVPTCREADGLAMSSRNQYLNDSERAQAPALYQTLTRLRDQLLAGRTDYAALEREGLQMLREGGFDPEYIAVRRVADLQPPEAAGESLVVLGAGRLGRARLIDNVRVSRETA